MTTLGCSPRSTLITQQKCPSGQQRAPKPSILVPESLSGPPSSSLCISRLSLAPEQGTKVKEQVSGFQSVMPSPLLPRHCLCKALVLVCWPGLPEGCTMLYVKNRWSPTAWQRTHSGALELEAEMLRLLALAMKVSPDLIPEPFSERCQLQMLGTLVASTSRHQCKHSCCPDLPS